MAADRLVFATGLWLGVAQASLGIAVLFGVGASGLVYFALLAGWIAAGALGAALFNRSRDVPHFAAALVLLGATRVLSTVAPFSTMTLVAVLASCVACGSYSGTFIARTGKRAADRRLFLLRENNGFFLGFALASALLFLSVRALDVVVLLGSVTLLVAKVRAT